MRHRCAAFTLLELIVVIAILGIIMGLLMPAVQNIRASAARMQCGNNLKQIALAGHLYHDVHERFPPAFRSDRRNEPMPYLHWFIRLLPHLEQDAARRQAETDFARARNPFTAKPIHIGTDRAVTVFACPTDWRPGTGWTVNVRGIDRRTSLTSYLGNSGTTSRLRDGVLFRNSRVNLLQITDGASNTLFAGERPPSVDLVYGWLYAGIGQDGTGSLDSVIGGREKNASFYPRYAACGPGPFAFRAGQVQNPCSAFQYWSLHSDGANFAFADGSVRFLHYSANDVLPALATRAGGEVTGEP